MLEMHRPKHGILCASRDAKMSEEVIHLLSLPLRHDVKLWVFGKWQVTASNELQTDDAEVLTVLGNLHFNTDTGELRVK